MIPFKITLLTTFSNGALGLGIAFVSLSFSIISIFLFRSSTFSIKCLKVSLTSPSRDPVITLKIYTGLVERPRGESSWRRHRHWDLLRDPGVPRQEEQWTAQPHLHPSQPPQLGLVPGAAGQSWKSAEVPGQSCHHRHHHLFNFIIIPPSLSKWISGP